MCSVAPNPLPSEQLVPGPLILAMSAGKLWPCFSRLYSGAFPGEQVAVLVQVQVATGM